MQSRTSLFDRTILKKNILKSWPVWTTYLIILFLMMGMGILDNLLSYSSTNYTKQADIVINIYDSLGAAKYIGFAMAILVAVVQFSYLHNGRASVFFHSLPINRKRLLATGYLSSVTVLFIPNLIFFFIGLIQSSVMGYTAFLPMLLWLLVVCAEELLFLTIAVLCMVLAGNSVVAAVMYFIGTHIFIIIYFLVQTILGYVCDGFIQSSPGVIFDFLTPNRLFGRIGYDFVYDQNISESFKIIGAELKDYVIPVVVALIYSCILAAITVILYKRRGNETAGDVIAFRYLRPVFAFMTGVLNALVMTVIIIEMYYDKYHRGTKVAIVILLVIFSLVGYYAARMIMNKTFRVIAKYRVSAFVFTVMIAAFGIYLVTGTFGIKTRVPESAASVDRLYCYSNGNLISLEDEESIEELLDIHRLLISNGEEEDLPVLYNVSFEYRLKDGDSFSRLYDVKEGSAPAVAIEQYVKKHLTDICTGTDCSVYAYMTVELGYSHKIVITEAENIKRIYNALREDIEAGHAKNLMAKWIYEEAVEYFAEIEQSDAIAEEVTTVIEPEPTAADGDNICLTFVTDDIFDEAYNYNKYKEVYINSDYTYTNNILEEILPQYSITVK